VLLWVAVETELELEVVADREELRNVELVSEELAVVELVLEELAVVLEELVALELELVR